MRPDPVRFEARGLDSPALSADFRGIPPGVALEWHWLEASPLPVPAVKRTPMPGGIAPGRAVRPMSSSEGSFRIHARPHHNYRPRMHDQAVPTGRLGAGPEVA